MMECRKQPTAPSTPQRTVMMLSTSGNDIGNSMTNTNEYTRLLPTPSKPTLVNQYDTHGRNKNIVASLTPERVQQKLQSSPRRATILAQHKQRLSAFTLPKQRHLVPSSTTSVLAEGELSFISRSTDTSFDSGLPHDKSYHPPTTQHPRLVQHHHPSMIMSPKPSLAYISPASTPARSETDMSSVVMYQSNIPDGTYPYHTNDHNQHQAHIVTPTPTTVHPTVVIPLYPNVPLLGLPTSSVTASPVGGTPSAIPTPSGTSAFPPLTPSQLYEPVHPVHLFEQQQEQLVLQQEQEQLQRQLYKEFYHDQQQQGQQHFHQNRMPRGRCNHDEIVLQHQIQNEFENEYHLDQLENSFYTFEEKKHEDAPTVFDMSTKQQSQIIQTKHSRHASTRANQTLDSSRSTQTNTQNIDHPLMEGPTIVVQSASFDDQQHTICMTETLEADLDADEQPLLEICDVDTASKDSMENVDGQTLLNTQSSGHISEGSKPQDNDELSKVEQGDTIAIENDEKDTSSLSPPPASPSPPQYYSHHESPRRYEESVVERIMSHQNNPDTTHDTQETTDFRMVLSPTEYRIDSDTPRVCNSASNTESDTTSQTEDEKPLFGDVDATWHTEAVDAMKLTMSRALIKLKTLATHITNNSVENIPDAVNTSTESSSSTASTGTNPEMNPEINLTELTKELRGSKNESIANSSTPMKKHQHHDSSTSVDTFGAPKPAIMTKNSDPPVNLKKPVPLNPGKMYPRLPSPAKKTTEYVMRDGKTYPKLAPIGTDRTRAVTPIVRMRQSASKQQDISVSKSDNVNKSLDHDILESQQKDWKEKMRNARKLRDHDKSKKEKKRIVEKLVVEGKSSKSRSNNARSRHKKSKTKRSEVSKKEPSFFTLAGHQYHIPVGIPTCKNDVIEIIEKFMNTRCGNLDDTYDGDEDDDDFSEDTNDLSFYSDEDYVSESESSTNSKEGTDRNVDQAVTNTTTDQNLFERNEQGLFQGKHKFSITVDIHDKQFIRQFIASTISKGIFLMQHKKNHTKGFRRPSKNVVYLKRGKQICDNNFMGPKLIWNEINGDDKGKLDLFDIHSLDKATALELENYPFAMPGRSLFLRMNKGDDHVFEARTEEEALHFVHGMRWLIARLAFNLIIGNISVSCELLDVERSNDTDDCYGIFPSNHKEEAQWTMAMNNATSHLVSKAAASLQ